jgi:beta-lactamase regulating signal transducer with metallopeptidase domain
MTLTLLVVAWLLTYLVHSTILLGGAWVLSATRIVRSPVAKDTLWKVCLLGGTLTATVYRTTPYRSLSADILLPSAAQPAPTPVAPAAWPATVAALASPAEIAKSAGGGRIVRRSSRITPDSSPITSHPSPISHYASSMTWPQALLGLWVLGAAALLVRLVVCRRRLTRSLRRRREIADGPLPGMLDALRAAAGVRRRIRLTASRELAGPVAMGAAEICLPERALTSLAPAEQRAVLAHELGHLVRQDPLWLAVVVACESLFYFQPLNRLARRRIQEAAEYLCDDWAVHQTGGSLTLAKCLAEVATWIEAGPRAMPVSGMAENRSQLVERVHRLLEGAQPSVRRVRMAVPVAVLALSSMAFAAPGVTPPCDAFEAASEVPARLVKHDPTSAAQGGPQTWATIRDGRVISFREGFLPQLIGQGHLGIRRGGRQIELGDGQRLLVNGHEASDDGVVSVCERDSLRIVNEAGETLWQLKPVRLSPEQTQALARSDDDDDEDVAADRMDSLQDEVDDLNQVAANVGATVNTDMDVAAITRAATELSERVTQQVSVNVAPQVAWAQKSAVRFSTEVAPRLAELAARIATQVVPAVVQSACGGGLCDSSASPVKRHKALTKHLR